MGRKVHELDTHKVNVIETLGGQRDIVRSVESSLGDMPLSRTKPNEDCSPLSFYMPEELGEAYLESAWSARERTRILVHIAKAHDEDPRASLAAIALLEKYNWNAVTASGQIQDLRVTRTSEKDGVVTQEDVKVMRMGGVEPPQEVIEVKMVAKEEDDEPKLEVEKPEPKEDEEGGDSDSNAAEGRDEGHKPPQNAFSGGLFGEDK